MTRAFIARATRSSVNAASKIRKDADGGLTLYIQNESLGNDKEANRLPAPKGPFFMAMCLY